MPVYIVLILAIILNALANILIKIGMLRIGMPKNIIELAMRGVTSPAIIFGVLSFIGALAFYAQVLSKMNLSIAYPVMTSVGFLIVISVSALYLKETITAVQILGFLAILVGVWLVANK